jgi:hypothetical protein
MSICVWPSPIVHSSSYRGGFARMIALICSAMRDSMQIIPHISTSLANSIAVVIATSVVHFLNTIRPRHTHCTSIWKPRGMTTPFISVDFGFGGKTGHVF